MMNRFVPYLHVLIRTDIILVVSYLLTIPILCIAVFTLYTVNTKTYLGPVSVRSLILTFIFNKYHTVVLKLKNQFGISDGDTCNFEAGRLTRDNSSAKKNRILTHIATP